MKIGTQDLGNCKFGGLQVDKIMEGSNLVWTHETPPTAITDFSASTYQIDKIVVTFTNATGIPNDITYNLVNNATGTILASNISSGYTYNTTTYSIAMRVDAVNNAGTTPSNVSTGTTRAPAGSQIFYSSGTFTNPRGYTVVTLCMIGGGGAGASLGIGNNIGGGKAGTIVSRTAAVVLNGTTAITCGAGGAPTSGNGRAGGTTRFGGYTAAGGAGGVRNNWNGGGTTSSCWGTYSGGSNFTDSSSNAYRGGQAGFYTGAHCRNQSGNAIRGSGGGAGAYNHSSIRTTNGGTGVVRVSWS